MVKELVHDPLFLGMKSKPAVKEDILVGRDLLDTLTAHSQTCVGMAANMIGVHKRIIAVANGPFPAVMFNPKILSKSGEYEAEEGCLSLTGVRKVKRWRSIRIQWQDAKMKEHVALLDGFQAQIVQHEIDHCDGILI